MWNWVQRKSQSVDLGGNKGSTEEAAQWSTWPNYEAQYLAKRLGNPHYREAGRDRFKGDGAGTFQKGFDSNPLGALVYYDKVSQNYKAEADACLKEEFVQWLEGKHHTNREQPVHENRPGQPRRRAIRPVYERGGLVTDVGDTLQNWVPTYWGNRSLTHLDGVRDFLRDNQWKNEEHEFKMNVLAEFGPQNLQEAWMYFKHWVKGRPTGPEECVNPRPKNYKGVDIDEFEAANLNVSRQNFMPDYNKPVLEAAVDAAMEDMEPTPSRVDQAADAVTQAAAKAARQATRSSRKRESDSVLGANAKEQVIEQDGMEEEVLEGVKAAAFGIAAEVGASVEEEIKTGSKKGDLDEFQKEGSDRRKNKATEKATAKRVEQMALNRGLSDSINKNFAKYGAEIANLDFERIRMDAESLEQVDKFIWQANEMLQERLSRGGLKRVYKDRYKQAELTMEQELEFIGVVNFHYMAVMEAKRQDLEKINYFAMQKEYRESKSLKKHLKQLNKERAAAERKDRATKRQTIDLGENWVDDEDIPDAPEENVDN